MIIDGWTVSLTLGGGALLLPLLYGGVVSVRILRRWDPAQATAAQLRLERGAELVATVIDLALGLLFVQAVLYLLLLDRLADLLAGAMCAIGVIRASSYAVPGLLVKGVALLAFVSWRAVHQADLVGAGFRFTRLKAWLLLGLALPLALADFSLQSALFIDLAPDAVTSCCSTAFRLSPSPTQRLLDGMTPGTTLLLFLSGLALLFATGLPAWLSLRQPPLLPATGLPKPTRAPRWVPWLLAGHGVAALLFFFLFLVAATALFAGYHYGSPAHRCPVCLLRGEPAWLGWPLYLALLGGAAQAIAAATLGLLLLRPVPGVSLGELARPRLGRSLLLHSLAAGLLAWPAVVWCFTHGVTLGG